MTREDMEQYFLELVTKDLPPETVLAKYLDGLPPLTVADLTNPDLVQQERVQSFKGDLLTIAASWARRGLSNNK